MLNSIESFTPALIKGPVKDAFLRALGVETDVTNVGLRHLQTGWTRAAAFLTAYRLFDVWFRLGNQETLEGPVTYPVLGTLQVMLGIFYCHNDSDICRLGHNPRKTSKLSKAPSGFQEVVFRRRCG